MMKYADEIHVLDFFSILNMNNIDYILLRNLEDELPKNLLINKDIDIIVNEKDSKLFSQLMIQNNWKQKEHPFRNVPFLYGMKPFQFYYKNGIYIDVCFELACRSLNKGEWFPLDMKIQEALWMNKKHIRDKPWEYCLSHEDEFVHLVTRCIFDKKEFTDSYIKRLNFLRTVVDFDQVSSKFKLIFFKYTKPLIHLISEKKYKGIIKKYLQYKDY